MRQRGFTLIELAVVLTIVAFLLASLMYTLSAQSDQRNFEETRRRLELAKELLLAFAVVNGRLPCPARSADTTTPATVAGDEVRNASSQCSGDSGAGAVEDYYGGTNAGVTLGLLPARTIGFQPVDPGGFAIDPWANRIRYAVAKTKTNCVAPLAPTVLLDPHFVSATNMKNNGLACQPNDLLICKSGSGITASTCGVTVPAGANQLMTSSLVVAIIFSTGKNGGTPTGSLGTDQLANLDGDPVFVYHAQTPSDFVNGEFDDQMTWITVGELYGRLVSAGVMP